MAQRVTTAAPPSVAAPPVRRAVLPVTVAAPFLVLMAYAAPAATLPQTAAGLDAGQIGQIWILNGIALGLSATLLTAGALADNLGRKRIFVLGAALLTVASLAAALAPNALVFVPARIVQGVSGAALLAASLGMIGHAFPGPARVKATALWGAMIGAGLTAGPLLSGLLAEHWSWRAIYGLTAVGAALLGAVAPPVLAESRADKPQRVDLPGVTALALGLTALLAAVTQGRTGWAQTSVAVLFAIAAVLLAGFVVIELRSRAPMLDLGLFRRRAFLASILGAIVIGLAVIGPLSYMPTVLARTHGFDALEAAETMAIWTGVSVAASIVAGRLRIPARPQLAIAFALGAAGALGLLGLGHDWSWPHAVGALIVVGVGSGLANAALARLAVESVPADRAGMGSGANNTARYIGGSLGVAASVAIAGSAHDLADGADTMFVAAAIVSAAGAVLVLLLRD
jgi:MFS family permease